MKWITKTARLIGIAALLATASKTTAQSLRSIVDAVCGIPGVRITDNLDPNSMTIIQSTASLEGVPDWSDDVTLGANTHNHDWFDPSARAERRRFYRYLKTPRPPLAPVVDFRLTDHLGYSHELLREGDAKVVVIAFTDNQSLGGLWQQLSPVISRYSNSAVRVWIVNSVDARETLAAAATQNSVTEPILHDAAQLVAKGFGARTAGEVVAINMDDFTEVYRGAASEICGTGSTAIQQNYLADALGSFLAGTDPAVTYARNRGTPLALFQPTEIIYSRDIAPLLLDKCIRCHAPGEIGSWQMTNYDTVALHSDSIRFNLLEGLMPPWHADKAYLPITNDYSITPAQQATLAAWIEAGALKDSAPDPLANHVFTTPPDWPLGTPDLILGFTNAVPSKAQGATIPYKYIYFPNPYPTDVWLKAAVIKPGDRRVVHHSLFFEISVADALNVIKTGNLGALTGLEGFFAGYVPGLDPVMFPANTGKLLKKGDYLVFQMHYTPIDEAVTDKTKVGFYFAPAPPAKELKTASAYTTNMVIPPNTKSYTTQAQHLFTKAATIYEMSPHMHLRGNSMRVKAMYPDGTSEIILNVPKYDFAWQTLYRLTTPKTVPANTTLLVTGDYDNSPWNPFNPNPNATVTFGEQTADEMFIGYINYTE